MKQRSITLHAQQGVVLVITLIMLLLLTIIGVTSMRSSSLQENMARNFRENILAFQAAEAALKSGEQRSVALYLDIDENIVTGENDRFNQTADKPVYELKMLANIKTSTEVGVPEDDEGKLVQVIGTGFGVTTSNNTPISTTQLQSTYLIEK